MWKLIALLALALSFQNCAPAFQNVLADADADADAGARGVRRDAPAELAAFPQDQVVRCAPPPAGASGTDTADHLQACVNAAAEGGIVELAPVTYAIQKPLVIGKSILLRTAGLDTGAPGCRENQDGRCAVIKGLSPLLGANYGLVEITAPKIAVHHIVVDGDLAQRRHGAEAQACLNATSNRLGMNVTVTGGAGHVFYRMSSLNTVCGSALAFAGVTPGLRLVENYVARAGIKPGSTWADGITVSDSSDSVVRGNEVIDATDVGIILGGCANCDISDNVVAHSDNFASSSFAAFMIYSWPATSGDYTGTVVTRNRIDCAGYRCGFGLLLGDRPWNTGTLKGGRYFGNSIKGAQVGFAVNDATDPAAPLTIGANTVLDSGGRFFAQQGLRDMPAYYISQASREAVRFEDGLTADFFPVDDFTNNIANWHTQDWRGIPGAGPNAHTRSWTDAPAAPAGLAAIQGLFDQYLPGCYTHDKGLYWQAWFARGGTMADFVWTLATEAQAGPSCLRR